MAGRGVRVCATRIVSIVKLVAVLCKCIKGMTSSLGCTCKNDEGCSKGVLCGSYSCVNDSKCLGYHCLRSALIVKYLLQ